MALNIHNTGTATTTTTDTTWATGTSGTGFKIYNGSISKLQIKKAPINIPAKRVLDKKGFWDDVEWKEYTSYIPRKSITGKVIIGKMHKRWRTPAPRYRGKGLGTHKQYAKTKELFEEKLRGKA